jgi:hypothetical protein
MVISTPVAPNLDRKISTTKKSDQHGLARVWGIKISAWPGLAWPGLA